MLAIIIPYYKLTFFEATLNSLSTQTDKRFKVIIGDDASAEDPTFIINKFEEKFDIFYHRFNENLGSVSLVKHWKRCIDLCNTHSDWLMILGDDDILGENVVERFYFHLPIVEQNNSNLIRYSTKKIYFGKEKQNDFIYIHPIFEKASDSFFRRFIGLTRSSLSEYIFSRISYEKYGFYDFPLAWHSDDLAWLNFSMNNNIYSINDAIVNIGISDINISGKNDNIKLKDEASILFLNYLIKNKLKLFSKKQRIYLIVDYEMRLRENNRLNLFEKKNIFFLYINNLSTLLSLKGAIRILLK
jgi:glycosyltransferase involved in cell wall biosynthesis